MSEFQYIIQPGWNGSSAEHWQSHWQALLGARRVEVSDWSMPHPDDWLEALDVALAAATKPAIVIAHSLGCIALAHYAQRRERHRIAGALLVAPADVEREDAPACLRPFAPTPRTPFPFLSRVVASTDDPFCRPERARALAADWCSQLSWLNAAGHINVESGHRRWEQGLSFLDGLAHDAERMGRESASGKRVVAGRRQA